jgi:hypothetical protein
MYKSFLYILAMIYYTGYYESFYEYIFSSCIKLIKLAIYFVILNDWSKLIYYQV